MTPTAPMTFTTHGLSLVPFYVGDTKHYHAYFRRQEPEIVFGKVDSGVPNRAKDHGTTFLDAVWEQAPFGNRGRPAVARGEGQGRVHGRPGEAELSEPLRAGVDGPVRGSGTSCGPTGGAR